MDIRSAQRLAMDNKHRKGFNTTDVPLEVCLLQGELAEFFQAWRRKQDDVGEELADVAIYLLGLAEMVGVDLQHEIASKMAKNTQRVYQRRQDGLMVRVDDLGVVHAPARDPDSPR